MQIVLSRGNNGLLQAEALPLLSLPLQQAQTACVLTPGPGIGTCVCDSGIGATDSRTVRGNYGNNGQF